MQKHLTISLIHPSRGRPKKAFETYLNWLKKVDHPVNIEHILSLDESDSFKEEYIKTFDGYQTKIIINPNEHVVSATNHAAKIATGDILIYLSDDFDCPMRWNKLILNKVKRSKDTWLLKVSDCLHPFDVKVLTIPIMSRGLYEKLCYFWHPDYRSMFVDEDLYWTCQKLNCLVEAPELKFPHLHPAAGIGVDDDTYIRSAANWNQGKSLFHKRKMAGFPL